MLYRSKAPFRLGIAGGGTDVSPYSDIYGGAILNVTIDRFAYATIRPTSDGIVRFVHINDDIVKEFVAAPRIEPCEPLVLQCGIYNSIVSKYNGGNPLSFELTTSMDVPSGSGLGTSSTLVVAILGAFVEWLKLPLGKYDIARYAYEIERIDLKMAGGKQDQYAATFGGVNFMEFKDYDRVIVNPLSIKDAVMQEWALNTILIFTDKRRDSSRIIEQQVSNVKSNRSDSVEAMHKVKEEAFRIKNCLLQDNLREMGEALNTSWTNKKKMADNISNEHIDKIYDIALANGALGGKISGAGGGGFMFFYCPDNSCYRVKAALTAMKLGEIYDFQFCKEGLTTWSVKNG
ncbi:MAG TPA: dehydrogenase [Bacteroidales bacterium]|jgi:D-glycero-alpha-D-manno-heptose-7-phosphate kinase|nr:dehydrogenase [Bacteroidales bacterium]HPB89102.1 dehydrogenase [Bacteroidales bacterium]HQN24305.1 dehydrogenase [Bacteroidales bacterium]HQP78943.1 dehydrogenase [Bacteroidales bacterium]